MTEPYLIHVVAGEGEKDLIGPQVIDPAKLQAEALGTNGAPSPAMALLLEPARKAFSSDLRARVRILRERAAPVRVGMYPLVGRVSMRSNATVLARWLHSVVGRRRVMFHCRGESAVEWAVAVSSAFPGCGIVADIRGAWPEEALHAAGFDGPEHAPPPLVQRYHVHLSRLQAAFASAGSVLTVSPGMLDWLSTLGVRRDHMDYVPCAVTGTQFREDVRQATRRRLGFEGRIVYAYVGILASYHSVEDGLIRFFRAVSSRFADAHLLCVTTEATRFRDLLAAGGVSAERATVMHAPHSEIPALLSAADCGLLLMRRCRLAPTWQPIKYGEYLASGLPVVVSPGVGVLDRQVAQERVGIVVDVFDGGDLAAAAEKTHALLREEGPEMRSRAVALCAREFVWAKYVDTWRRAYQRSFAWSTDGSRPAAVRFGA